VSNSKNTTKKALLITAGIMLFIFPFVWFFLLMAAMAGGSQIPFWIVTTYPITYASSWIAISQINEDLVWTISLIAVYLHLLASFFSLLLIG